MTNFKMQSKRIPTNEEGIFYKSIINENGKEVDKAYIIRYRENDNVDENTLRNMVYRLRKKLNTEIIITIKDLGYLIKT